MRNYVIINGVNSNTIQGLAINILPPITKPMMRSQIEEIDGRDGDLVTELGYSAYDKTMEIGLWGTYDVDAIIKYFTGEGTIVFSNEPDKYYYFQILNQIDYEKLLKFKKATVTFHCQPFKYPVEEAPIQGETINVSGSGASLTLDNTVVAPMNVDLKGNTYQAILPSEYTQVEYIESTGTQYIDTGYKSNGNTRVVIDFIANQTQDAWLLGSRIAYNDRNYSVLLWNGGAIRTDYYVGGQDLSGVAKNTRYVLDKNKNISTIYQNGTQVSQITATYTSFNTNLNMYLFASNNNGTVSAIGNIKLYSCKIYDNDVLIRDYIPCYRTSDSVIGLYDLINNQFYTNAGTGTFDKGNTIPNPSYPQDIHVVSGDNTIEICGKNVCNITSLEAKYYSNGIPTLASQLITINNFDSNSISYSSTQSQANYNIVLSNVMQLRPNTEYTISFDITTTASNNQWFIYNYDESGQTWYTINYRDNNVGLKKKTFTTNSLGQIALAFGFGNSYGNATVSNIQIELGNQATTYQPYESHSYLISLGEENLINNVMTSQTLNGVQFSVNEDKSIWISGTATARTEPKLWTNASGKLILKANTTYYNNSNMTLYIYHGQYTIIDVGGHYTPTEDKTVQQIYIRVENGETINKTLYPMLSTKQNASYYPYGKSLEMCKIGTSQDTFIKNSGINLLDYSTCEIGDINGSTGQEETQTTRIRSDFIKIEPSTNYVCSLVGGQYTTFFYTESKTYIAGGGAAWINSGTSFTSPNNAGYVRLKFWKMQNTAIALTDLKNVMFNIGSAALDYEPYGTGEWYKKGFIGKAVLTGNEGIVSTPSTNRFNIDNAITDYKRTTSDVLTYISNQYKAYKQTGDNANFNVLVANENYGFNMTSSELSSNVRIKDTRYTTTGDFKNWLLTNNLIIYYLLSNPTFTKITDEALISQLETTMYSFNPQTNITQTNDDAPFNLDVSLSYTDTMNVNNVGNIYAKPILTLEGSGNIGIVLNDIEILNVDLGDGGKITIDVPNLQAYDPDDNTLLNRLVTGDYMKLLIQEGDNTIAFSGSVTSATLTNYTRWI